MRPSLVLLGTDERVIQIGLRAAENNIALAGIWDPDHNRALLASLRLGCCAFPDPAEPLSQAHWVVFGCSQVALPPQMMALDVSPLQIDGLRLNGPLSPDWAKWLVGIGFEPEKLG